MLFRYTAPQLYPIAQKTSNFVDLGCRSTPYMYYYSILVDDWTINAISGNKIIGQNKIKSLPTDPNIFQHVIGNEHIFSLGLSGKRRTTASH